MTYHRIRRNPLRDSRGTEIEVGQRVAYNLSGQVAEGDIVSTKGWTIGIKLIDCCAGMDPGHISKVKNPTSILVLTVWTTPLYPDDD